MTNQRPNYYTKEINKRLSKLGKTYTQNKESAKNVQLEMLDLRVNHNVQYKDIAQVCGISAERVFAITKKLKGGEQS